MQFRPLHKIIDFWNYFNFKLIFIQTNCPMALILCHNGIVTKRMHATISTAPANFQYAPNPDLTFFR
jgi:hypothetical protein